MARRVRSRVRNSLIAAVCVGAVSIASQSGVATVQGAGVDTFHGLTPRRLLDTRVGNPTFDGLRAGEGALGPAGRTDLKIAGRGGVPLTGASSVALNVTASAQRQCRT